MRSTLFPQLSCVLACAALLACDAPAELIPQDIHIAQDAVDFGMVPTGNAVSTRIRVHNAGDATLTFSIPPTLVDESNNPSFTLVTPWTDTEETPAIEARSYVEFEITYAPSAEEDAYASVLLYTNDPDEANRVIVLTGSSFRGYPAVYVTPSLVEFGFVASGNTAESEVEIWNVGEVPVDVVGVSVGGSESQFAVLAEPQYPIPPGEKALVPVSFQSEGGNHEIASLTVEIADAVNPYYVVNLSANSPGSTNNSPPQIDILDPTEPKVFYLHQDLYIEARAFDAQQPNIGLYCTLESYQEGVDPADQLGLVEQNTSDPTTSIVEFVLDIDDGDFEDAPGLHTLTLCCTDVFNETACETLVVSIDEDVSVDDLDGDGYDPAQGDCDDTDPLVYPAALELPDNADNDCDGTVDEDSENSDDDFDGVSEAQGDCDDSDGSINPNAEEEADFLDNDCDGTIDEGTVNYDDDGDGFSEALGDCMDDDVTVYRDATEWCDQKDNDCDGLVDEDCIDNTPPLIIIGGLVADKVVVRIEEEINLSLTVISDPEAELVYDWNADGGEFTAIDGPTAVWKAPSENGKYSVFCNIIDTTNDLDKWAFLEVTVSRTDPTADVIQRNTSCSLTPVPADAGAPAAVVAFTLLAILGLRRRS